MLLWFVLIAATNFGVFLNGGGGGGSDAYWCRFSCYDDGLVDVIFFSISSNVSLYLAIAKDIMAADVILLMLIVFSLNFIDDVVLHRGSFYVGVSPSVATIFAFVIIFSLLLLIVRVTRLAVVVVMHLLWLFPLTLLLLLLLMVVVSEGADETGCDEPFKAKFSSISLNSSSFLSSFFFVILSPLFFSFFFSLYTFFCSSFLYI